MIAAQLYTLRDRLRDRQQLAAALGGLREIGYEGVEVAGLGTDAADHFGDELARSGLKACASHESLESLAADLPEVAERCRAWGCGYVVIPSIPRPYHSADGFMRFAHEAMEIAARLSAYGLGLAYHNHTFELERWEGKTGLEILFDAAPAEALKAELDTYWLQAAGANPAKWLRKLYGRVPLVHLKDMTVVDGRAVQTEVGEGNLDWNEILQASREAGVEWLIVEQDETTRDPLESLAISHRNLAAMLR
jgi:sugar phosphate isomerase/epimerase